MRMIARQFSFPEPELRGSPVRRVLWWARRAGEEHRVQAANALARALLQSSLSPDDRCELELALLTLIQDPAPSVRLAIAEAVAPSAHVPRQLLEALLADRGEIAALALEHSPLLSDDELVDRVALCDGAGQSAIARRPTISPALAGAVSEIGTLPAVLALLGNPGARIAGGSLKRIVERFGHEPAVRDELLRRPDLPIEIRVSLAAALSRSLNELAARCGGVKTKRLAESAREACERALVAMALSTDVRLVRRTVVHLRTAGLLTPSLIMRAALSGGLRFCEAAFSELGGVALDRVAALLRQAGPARDALYACAGLPNSLQPALLAVVSALYERPAEEPGLCPRLIARAFAACATPGDESVRRLLARYDAEAMKQEARLAPSETEQRHGRALAERDRPAASGAAGAPSTRVRPAPDRATRESALEQAA
jgi:uncharacterized protein (DUF2336 family)